ncbi:MAG: hypothetical protein WD740_06230 [Anaerolineales bacterium]
MENTNEPQHYGPPPMDVFISVLGALVIGAVIWAGGYGTVLTLNFAGEAFGIYPPANSLIANAIQIGYVAVPILAGLMAFWISYRFLLKLD